jgi:thiosulfate/3-mercaptopyruvate sulfurtransferase
MSDYARDDILVGAEWLQTHLDDPRVRIVDCDLPDAYRRAHIPGAVNPADHYYKDPADKRFIAPPDQFAQMMAALGIANDTEVVGYDQSGLRLAARLWWSLQYYGHKEVRILDGGWDAWLASGRPATTETTKVPQANFLPAPADESIRAGAEYVVQALSDPGKVVLDVRSRAEWEGKDSRGNQRAGHMPGAIHREWLANLSPDQQHFRPAGELRSELEALGVTPDKEIVTVCQAGIRAASALVTLKLLGYERVRNYDGSFADWGNREDTPLI